MVAARWKAHGSGAPVTLVVPGLGATEGEARIPASGLRGTRVVVTFPGHGDAPDAPAGYWHYPRVADEVRAIADEVSATRAVGVSLGSGALTRLVADSPDRFERLVLMLPAALDRPRGMPAAWALEQLAEAVREGDTARLTELVAAEVPEGANVGGHVQQRVAALMRLGEALASLQEQSPVDDGAVLASATADVLVVGATDDPLHPGDAAKATAAAFNGRLELLPSKAPMLTHRSELRTLLTGFLTP